jgi:DNA invertase Pin-like site-specific DNA recombinase
MFQMLGVFSEFERAMISERVKSSLARVRAAGKVLGRKPLDARKAEKIRKSLNQGVSINKTAKALQVGVGTVHRIKVAMASQVAA